MVLSDGRTLTSVMQAVAAQLLPTITRHHVPRQQCPPALLIDWSAVRNENIPLRHQLQL